MHYCENKNVFNINSLERYAAGFPVDENNTPTVLELNGDWYFKFYKSAKDLPENFFDSSFFKDNFNVIKVPSEWQIQGYDTPMYTNIVYPYALSSKNLLRVPKISATKNSVGVYAKDFELSNKEKKVFIRFDGINSCGEIYVNGKFVGYSEDTFDFQEYDVTDFVSVGKNRLCVAVFRYCTGSYLEDQDMWRLSGIFRDVNLIFKPYKSIFDFYARSIFTDGFDVANFIVSAKFENADGLDVVLKLLNSNGDIVISEKAIVKDNTAEFSREVFKPILWSNENPYLYSINLEIADNGVVVDRRICKFGFREIKILPMIDGKGPFIMLNGVPIKIRGVNRHEFHPEYGHAVPKELIRKDLEICLQNNITSIRTCHYPNSRYFYELCDELGILVMCENNLESHGLSFMLPKNSKYWTEQCVYRVRNMVNTYKNHPCIISWSLGNESGFGNAFVEMKKAVLEIDNTRFIHYEEDISAKVSDVMSEMYATLEKMEKLGKNEQVTHCNNTVFCLLGVTYKPDMYKNLPYIQCEYAHCMGNSLGNFDDYWKEFKKYDRLSGGYIWDFADQSIKVINDGVTEWRYGGDFGDKPNSGSFAFNGIVRGDRSPNPALFEVKKVYQMVDFTYQNGKLIIKNNFYFTNLEGCILDIIHYENGVEAEKKEVRLPSIKPNEEYVIPYECMVEGFENSFVVEIKLGQDMGVLKSGHKIAYEQFIVNEFSLKQEDVRGEVSFIENDWEISITSKDMQVIIDKNSGGISSICKGERERIKAPFLPNFYRAAIDNDRFAQVNLNIIKKIMGVYRFRDALKKMHPKNVSVATENGVVVVKMIWKINGIKSLVTTYKIGDGEIDVSMSVISKVPLIRYGFSFATRESVKNFGFYAKGPHENYCDRKTSAILKVFDGVAEDFNHEYLYPQENGNHTEARYLDLGGKENGLIILAEDKPFEFGVLPYTLKKLDEAKHLHELVKDKYYTVTIDGKQRGVGGDIPALACLKQQYKILPKKEHTLHFRMIIK